MEYAIAIFLGAYLVTIGVISLVRITKDFKGGKK